MKLFTQAFLMLGALAAVIGCGGGGGGGATTTGNPAGSARVGIFVTDDLSTAYDHVWVTIHRVEIKGPNNNETVYNNPTGKVVDLRALNQAGNQIFSMLGEAVVPAGNYTHVEINLDDDVVLFPTGATTGLERKFAGSRADGTKELKFNLTRQTITGAMDIVADFDLSKWTEDGALVHAVVVQGNDDNIGGNQKDDDFKGTIANLTGTSPNFSFDLTVGTFSMRAVTTEATTVFNSNGAPNPTLVNGTRVEVRGTFDTTSRVLAATSVKIKTGNDEHQAEVEGAVSNIAGDTFDLSAMEVRGFVPTETTVNIQIAPNARFFTDRGISITKEEFFAELATLGFAEAEGIYNEATNTLVASKLKLEDEGDDSDDRRETEVEGTASNPDANAGTFQVAVQSWEGTVLERGTVITVVTNAGTRFKDTSRASFFAAIQNGGSVEVKGTLERTTLTAERVELEDDDNDDDDDDDNGGSGGGSGKG